MCIRDRLQTAFRNRKILLKLFQKRFPISYSSSWVARQDTDSSELGLQETFAGAASELRLETEAIAEAIPQVRVLNLFNVSLVS